MTKATSWPWNSTLPSASTICLSPASVGIQCSPSGSRSAAVSTATTPGSASAAALSIETTRAWAWGLRTKSPNSIPGSLRSST